MNIYNIIQECNFFDAGTDISKQTFTLKEVEIIVNKAINRSLEPIEAIVEALKLGQMK